MKIKEKIENLLNILKRSVEKFPITIISIFVLTLIYTVCIGNTKVDWELIGKITLCITIFASTTYLIEVLVKEKKPNLIIYYLISFIWAITLTLLTNVKDDVMGMSNELFIHILIRIIVCHILSTSILSMYFNYKNSEKTFAHYLINVVVGIFKTSLIYGLLAIGSSIIVSIFVYLILNGRGYILLGRVEILLLGLYYVPTMIYTFYKQEGEIGKFVKIVMKYVLGTLVMIAFAIIYLYIIKILILRNMPSNQIFRILSSLFIIGMPIWTMGMAIDEGKTFDKINSKLPYLFVPFIFLQMYSIGVRIGENGMTEARYLCVMLIIFEIIYTLIYAKNKTKIENNLLVIFALVIISLIAPFINMFRVSALNQFNILRKYDQKDNITKEERTKLNGAYWYLQEHPIGKQYLNSYQLRNDVSDGYEYDENIENRESLDVYREKEYVNVNGYKRLYSISASSYSYSYYNYSSIDENETIEEIFKNISFDVKGMDQNIKVNMLSQVNQYIRLGKSLEKEFDDINEIIIDNNRKIVLDSINIDYDKTTNELYYYNITGYLLEK